MARSPDEEDEKSFTKGLMAHLILVPCWTMGPPLLVAACVGAGRPHGWRGMLGGLGLFGVLAASSSFIQRAPVCAVLIGIARTAPSMQTFATVCASAASMLVTMCSMTFARQPALVRFLCGRSADFYAQAEVRGALEDLKREKCCLGFHPHGILSAGFTINGVFNRVLNKSAGKINWLIDATLRHKNPSFRWLCESVRDDDRAVEAADKRTFLKVMATGENIGFVPGGFQDVVAYRRDKDVTVLRNRKGFVKYCLQFGYRLVPVYTFGECETYSAFSGLNGLRNWLAARNVPMVAFFGWSLFPVLPRPQTKIISYVGQGIELPKIAEPTSADVDYWHGKYMTALQQLYMDNRVEAGYPDGELRIL